MFDQSDFDARLEWGPEGLAALLPGAATVVVVDVLSFSTAVDVAVARGARVYPARRRDSDAGALATRAGADLAASRPEVSPSRPWSLSPAGLARLPRGARLVLPSPNGATTCLAAAGRARVLAGCLRNAAAVARAIVGPVAVIAAGERWPDGRLRPAWEDLVGAGAILDALAPARPSPEAGAAIAAFRDARADLAARLAACGSGRELIALGFEDDVRVAAALDESAVAPLLGRDERIDAPAF